MAAVIAAARPMPSENTTTEPTLTSVDTKMVSLCAVVSIKCVVADVEATTEREDITVTTEVVT